MYVLPLPKHDVHSTAAHQGLVQNTNSLSNAVAHGAACLQLLTNVDMWQDYAQQGLCSPNSGLEGVLVACSTYQMAANALRQLTLISCPSCCS